MLSARDIREFRGFLRQATDRQVQGIYDKETRAGRDDYAELAVAEAERRGIFLEGLEDHATKKRRRRHDRSLTDAEVGALQARGRKAAADGLIGIELDRQLKAEGLSPTEHRVVRAAFNDALEDVVGKQYGGAARHSTKKKSPAQLDREIAEALGGRAHATVGGTRSWLGPGVIRAGDRVTIVDRFGTQRTGRAVMRGPHRWVLNMGGKHGTPGIATDENIVSVKSPGLRSGHATKKQSSHATKRAIPGVSKWNTYAGGTGAAEGKHSYDLHVPEGQYTISPYTRSSGRHAGYLLKFAATGGRPRGTHGGLWHDLGSHKSPQAAASAAAKHYARGFE